MILSFSNNFLFLKTTKTAGTSFEIALSRYAGPKDVVTPVSDEDEERRKVHGAASPRNHLCPANGLLERLGLKQRRKQFYNHIPAAEVRDKIGQHMFGRLLKVSIVRNPYDMAVSRYFWTHRDEAGVSREHFRGWLRSRPAVLSTNRNITHIDGACAIDLMIRFENLEEDVLGFARRAGLPDALYGEFNAIRAKGHYRPKQMSAGMMFDGFDEGRAIIEEMFEEDIRTYGYTLAR